MLQILLRITEAVMNKPKDNQKRDLFAHSLAGLLFRVCLILYLDNINQAKNLLELLICECGF